jgi:hypothetical protein
MQDTISRGMAIESSPPVTVEVFDPLESSAYDEMLGACPDSVPFHSREWLRVIRDTYGHKSFCFVVKSGPDIRALLPLVEVRSWLTGSRGVAVPFADNCPALAADSAAQQLVLEAAIKHGQQHGWKYLELRGGRNLMGDAQASLVFNEHILNLAGGADALFMSFAGRMRTAVRKAEKEGVRAEIYTTAEAVKIYYELHCATRRKHGVPPQPFSFFRNIFDQFISRKQGMVVIGWHQQVPVAAAVFIHYRRQAVYKFSASNEAYLNLCGNNVVLWEAIRWYANNGFSAMHFGRTSVENDGLRKYKIGWATTESKLEYFRYDITKGAFVTVVDRAEGSQNKWMSRMPRPLFDLAGRILYRHLS